MKQGHIDEQLWEMAEELVKGQKTEQAVTVISSIASHAVGRYSGTPVEIILKPMGNKKLDVWKIHSLKKLAREVSHLEETKEYGEAREKAFHYLDEIVHLLASSEEEERELRRKYFQHLIHLRKKRRYRKLHAPKTIQLSTTIETYTTSEAAEILHVSDQTIRRMCDAGKFPGATRTEGGHWRIPQEYFKVSLDQSREMKTDLANVRKKSQEGGEVDEFDL
ncbi:helix-turn-helix domain-containing protein [Sporosarcina highlanderae]|uniref:Helix-turn-helix domain-containing protein n=1 Tax=Sporosarcina highlanderae TaxID=3035916 RepID=A0ABT8JSK7_9BACL|nr:helix-turn-helix domain-containing protein [Sporosarcina highlanderae]MDN4608150.1 helix-turn-helix domain-containing protein [Sporosarcina highlanderae]